MSKPGKDELQRLLERIEWIPVWMMIIISVGVASALAFIIFKGG